MRRVVSDNSSLPNWYVEEDGKPVLGPFRSEAEAIKAEMLAGNRQNAGPCHERKAGRNGDHEYLDGLCRFCGRDEFPPVITSTARLVAELESTAGKLSDVWIHLDAYARGEQFTPAMAASILKHQQAPGWKTTDEAGKQDFIDAVRESSLGKDQKIEWERVCLWEAINEYAASCGGDTSSTTADVRRMKAVSAVERLLPPLGLIPALVKERGAVVSSADCSEMELAFARSEGRFWTDANGYGYVVRMREWLANAEAALEGVRDQHRKDKEE